MNTKNGGKWLAAARSWVQHHCLNGSTVQWNTNVELQPPITAAGVESLAECVAKAAIEEETKMQQALLVEAHLLLSKGQASKQDGAGDWDNSWEFRKLRWMSGYYDLCLPVLRNDQPGKSDYLEVVSKELDALARVRKLENLIKAFRDDPDEDRIATMAALYQAVETTN